MGTAGSRNIVMDNNEIMARNAGNVSPLHLQADGGPVSIGGDVRIGGDLGIGITNPQSDLHISGGNGSVELRLEADKNNDGEGNQPKMTFVQDGGIITGQIGYFGETNNFEMKNNSGGARIILQSDGSICIGKCQ